MLFITLRLQNILFHWVGINTTIGYRKKVPIIPLYEQKIFGLPLKIKKHHWVTQKQKTCFHLVYLLNRIMV